ncbi:DUF2095 family protein [Archaeoglobus veneficus]|uniref:DUF2095 domain-containing protein n=1 Tax=Archaeoglobus veneficus (strain DSM 11195 / SNP6) TaxID=693661 RepID=F2KPT9_ARCVS|nr:DUF2095 family protein [Archaeoglobus veneficus]AEA46446.1 Protein of unknown function DUF2095 [Archaeoglobus veneficus SNP6]
MLEWDREKFRKMFPNLFHELEGSHMPTVLDHLEVCRSAEEALEVINYFERIGEITPEYASFLRSNVKKLGIIGTRRRGDYERRGLVD